ncbi:MAG: hypothetical protein RLY31_1323 [Bacteroidota bacterium]|jgi:cell division protein ZapA
MEDTDSKQLTVIIAARPYPLKIKATDEPVIRRIVKDINDKVNHLQLSHPEKDKQDCLALTLLTFAVELHKASHSMPTGSADLTASISRLRSLLNSVPD